MWTLYPLALAPISLPEDSPTCLFNLLLTADSLTQARVGGGFLGFFFTHLPAFSKPIHPESSAVHFSLFILSSPHWHKPLLFFSRTSRYKRVFLGACLPAERALREHCGEFYLSEADHLSPGTPDQQWHLRRYATPSQHQSTVVLPAVITLWIPAGERLYACMFTVSEKHIVQAHYNFTTLESEVFFIPRVHSLCNV